MATRRHSPTPTPTIVPSLSESSLSDNGDQDQCSSTRKVGSIRTDLGRNDGLTLRAIVSSTAFRRRFSCQSSLPWGHRPSPLIGASCFLFLLPVPYLLRACQPVAAALLGCVTASSYLSDHVYTGLESWAHAADRVLAPITFAACLQAVYVTCGARWASVSLVALLCHLRANYHAKHGGYERFVVWHSLWHLVGVGVILVCFTVNGEVGQCWDESEWKDFFMSIS